MEPPSSDGFEICETPPVPRRQPETITLSQPSQTEPPSSSPDTPLANSVNAPSSALSSIKLPSRRLPPRLQPVAGPSGASPRAAGGGRGAGTGGAGGVLELGSSEDEDEEVVVQTEREDEIEIVSYKAASRLTIALSDNSSDDLPAPDQLGFGTFARRPPSATTSLRPTASTSALLPIATAPLPRSHSTASEYRPATAASTTASTSAYTAAQKGKGKVPTASLPVLGDSDTDEEVLDPYDAMMARKRKQPPVAGAARGASDSLLAVAGPPLKKKASTASTSAPDKAASKQAAAAARAAKAQAKLDEAAFAKAHRAANTLQSDRKKTAAELTCHIDGLALRPPPPATGSAAGPPAPPAHGEVAFALPLKRGVKAKPSVWPEIAQGLSERLGPYSCGVEVGEEEGRKKGHDLRSEGAVRWTRVCDRRWDDARGEFVPLGKGNEVVVEEDSRLIFMTALELSWLIAKDELQAHIAAIQTLLPPHVHLFLMISGLGALFVKMRSAKNRQYKNGVLGDGDAPAAPSNIGIGEDQPDKDRIEIELVKLETAQRLFLIRVESTTEAVDWLEQLTFDVGFKPHARHRFLHAAALGGSGDDKVASGRDLQDTWIKMLATLKAVTEPLAKAIVAEYPTVRDLYEGWAGCAGERERREMLMGIRKGNKVNGAATDRSLGKAMSERIYSFFTATNPDQPLN